MDNRIRKNAATISQAERDQLANAIVQIDMTKFYPDSVSYWDKQDQIHQATHVHGGPSFLPWHRELCNRFEALLREVDPEVSLHYWDWTTDPRASDNGAGATTNLFAGSFMGSPSGRAGAPFESFDNNGVFWGSREQTGNPADPPQQIGRNVNNGNPGSPSVDSDAYIIGVADALPEADQWETFRRSLEGFPNHNSVHGYIGQTIGNAHSAFEDPFVFLLHSNVDRLWAMWQTIPGREWRLDPDRVYGKEGTHITITENLEPWAGGSGLRPWATPDDQQEMRNSKALCIVTPPPYDTLPEVVDTATKERIFHFLNSATTAKAIAGDEPQEGPVRDDPSKGYGDQVRDYDIGITVAQRILDKRATLGPVGYTDLDQLRTIRGFGKDKLDDLIYSFGPAFYGKWEQLCDSPVYVVHAALLRTGKVLMFAGAAESGLPLKSAVWNPKSGHYTQRAFGHDLFCSHHSFLADGKLLVNGGDTPTGHTLKTTYVFDPDTETWTNLNKNMNHARWYPTTLTLGANEGVITFSGDSAAEGTVDEAEVFDFNKWTDSPSTANKVLRIYPGMHLLPNGTIFYTGTRWDGGSALWNAPQTALFDLNTNKWSNVGQHIYKDRTEGMSVTLPPDNKRIMVLGGRGDHATNVSTDSVEMIDFNDGTPKWKSIKDMHFRRRNVNAVLLPTGKVLVCAGIEGFKWDFDPKPVYDAEEYDPDTNSWTKLARMKVARQYHSCSVLLPDARVLNLGSVMSGGGHSLIKDVEVFSPPYLFWGPRPAITGVPATIHHGSKFDVATPDVAGIKKVVLVRPTAVTHHTDTDQRVIPLEFSKSGTHLEVTAPNGNHPHYDAIRGHYMLFILNDKDVPSEGKFVELD